MNAAVVAAKLEKGGISLFIFTFKRSLRSLKAYLGGFFFLTGV